MGTPNRKIYLTLAALCWLVLSTGCGIPKTNPNGDLPPFSQWLSELFGIPFIISAAVLLCVFTFMFFLFQKKRHEGMRLERLVQRRNDENLEIAVSMQRTLTKLEAVISNYKGVIWSVNIAGEITTFNGQYLKKLGFTPSFLEGKKIEIARQKNMHPDIIENIEKTFREGPQDWTSDINGRIFHSTTTPMYDSQGTALGIVGSTDDITEFVTIQRELETALITAKEANRIKSDFLAKMSHEIRTPMNVILGIIEMQMEKNTLPLDTIEALNKVHNSGYLLLNIINDILDLSKIEAGKLELSPAIYDVASMISDTVQLNLMRYENKPIEFKLMLDEKIPSKLFGDELRIKQILNNILSNAFKYTNSGEVSLSAFVEEMEAGTQVNLILKVCDTGSGMTPEEINMLFSDYSRFNIQANRTIEGTGLGMNITKHLIDFMNGGITVESEPGKGSAFTIRLPQGYVNSEILGIQAVQSLHQLNFNKLPRSKKKPQITREYMPYGKVLIVDDMEPNLYVARGLLAPYGLSMQTAVSGYEAIDKIKNDSAFDIIFMDHYMPGMDGIETTKAIRDLGYTRPIVALTANALAGQADMFLSNGFDGFISKPIDIRQLNAVLNKLIRDKYPAKTVEASRRLKDSLLKTTAARMGKKPNRALVVDDFLPNLNLASGMLRKYKIQADCVLSGQEAIDLIRGGEPVYNFVLMDHLMPDMDGIETTRLIREIDSGYAKNIPIVALTANETIEKEEFMNNGFQEVISKPLSIKKIDIFIKNWISDKISNDMVTSDPREEEMTSEIPGIDKNKLMELYDGDMDIFLPVLRSYLSVIPETLKKMSMVSAETLSEYTISVHGVKSTSESIGAEEARKMALELEQMAKAGNLSGVLAKNEALVNYVYNLLDNIQNWLNRQDAK
jgi:PAS domain S-box-containing protein